MKPARIFLSPPHLGEAELEYVKEAFASNYIAPVGPMVDAFEQEFAARVGIPHALALSSGTAATHLALHGLGVGPGDEVMVSTLTFVGSVSPVVYLGATPVFIDADRATWNMDPDLLAEELSACAARGRLPRAVVPTDLYGQCVDLDRIMEACAPYGIPVVVDAAESLGATYKGREAGAGAGASIYSFNGNKVMTTGGGGMLASTDAGLIRQARFLAQQARDPGPYYEHSQIGFNYRMSNVLAAIGRGQLRVLDQRLTAKRRLFAAYQQALGEIDGIGFMPEAPYGRASRWLTVILITPEAFGRDADQVRQALEEENIEARPVCKPMHRQPVFQGCRYRGGAVAEELFKKGLCLPSGTAMGDEEFQRVTAAILNRP